MGGSRPNEHDRERVAQQITDPDVIISQAELDRCRRSVETWHGMMARWRTTEPSPPIGAALYAGYCWLELYCPACRQVARVDLRPLDRHPRTPVHIIAAQCKCQRCGRDAPFPVIQGLHKAPQESAQDTWMRKHGLRAEGEK
jgi:hypothetical protein